VPSWGAAICFSAADRQTREVRARCRPLDINEPISPPNPLAIGTSDRPIAGRDPLVIASRTLRPALGFRRTVARRPGHSHRITRPPPVCGRNILDAVIGCSIWAAVRRSHLVFERISACALPGALGPRWASDPVSDAGRHPDASGSPGTSGIERRNPFSDGAGACVERPWVEAQWINSAAAVTFLEGHRVATTVKGSTPANVLAMAACASSSCGCTT
jgi:hypothetical protein